MIINFQIKLIFLVLVFFINTLLSQTTNEVTTNEVTTLFAEFNNPYNFDERNERGPSIDFWGGRLVNNIEFLTYYRNSYVIEITGNEATFGAALRFDMDYVRPYGGHDYWLTIDFYILEQLSLSGRFYENFNPPVFYPNELMVDVHLFDLGPVQNRLQAGIIKPVFDVIPMESHYLPVVFGVGRSASTNTITNDVGSAYINHALVTGHRDLPIAYLITPHYDTGVLWQLRYQFIEFLLGMSNGEVGLDSNSAKSIIGRLAYHDEDVLGGLAFSVGNLASVPIKENQHMTKMFLYWNVSHFTLGMEVLALFHGLRDLGTLTRDVKNEFQLPDGFFSPFTVYNDGSYDASSQVDESTVYGYSASLFFKFKYDEIETILHGSIYDPNLLSESREMYQRRYRGFTRFTYNFTPFIKSIISYTFTYDHYFLFRTQFYDTTEPRELHPIIDHDFYVGMTFSFN